MSSFAQPTAEATAGSPGSVGGHMVPVSRHPGTGWVTFAGVILILSGLLNLVDGLWALDVSDEAVSGAEELLWHSSSIETWGWIYTIAGAVLVLVGIGVLTRNPLARWVGVGAASVSMIINMMWVFVFPIAALIHVTLAALVIYGLTAYRDDVG